MGRTMLAIACATLAPLAAASAEEPILGAADMARMASSFENPNARCRELYRVIATAPDTAIAAQAARDLEALEREHPYACKLEEPKPVRDRAGGELELVLTQTVIGVALAGYVLPSALDVDMQNETPAWLGLAGFAGGTTAGLLSSALRVTPGQTMAITTGELLGGWNAVGLQFLTAPKGEDAELRRPRTYVAASAGVGIGAAAGLATAAIFRPDAGDMALLRSGGTWGTLAAQATVAGNARGPRQAVPRLVLGTDLGAATGLLLATQLDWSRERTNLVDFTGYAGLAAGWAASEAWMRADAQQGDAARVPLIAGGGAAGLVLGALATKKMGDDSRLAWALPSVHASPTPDGTWSLALGIHREL